MHLHHHPRPCSRPNACIHSSPPHAGNPAARCSSSRRSRVGANPDAVCFELEAVLQGLEPLVAAWSLAVNTRTCPKIAACRYTPGAFSRHVRQLSPALQELRDAPLLLRLLHEEGIVGARSTAGRTVRRPLLVNEVLEHWQAEILPTCVLRWSQRADAAAAGSSADRSSHSSFEQRMQDAWERAQASVPWRVLDTAHQQHGSSSSSSSGQPAQAQPAAGASSSQRPTAAVTSTSTSSSRSRSVAVLTAPAPAAAQADEGVATAVVQPHASIVQCINSCRQQVFVASAYPPAVTQAALAAVQLRDVAVLHGSSMQACVQQLEQQLPAAAAPRQLVVLSSPNRAAGIVAQEQLDVQVGEWACRAPSLRAKALTVAQCPDGSGPRLGLLSECALAELLGVAECEAVMDGIDWRRRADT